MGAFLKFMGKSYRLSSPNLHFKNTIPTITTMLNTGKLAGKTVYITGASRGIGEKIGLKCAQDGANVVVAAKTAEPHPKLPGTIYTAAKKSNESGKWYLDLKNGAGSCGKGEAATDADCTFKMKDEHFQQMFTGKLKPASAFMSGKMKLQGDMGKALKLEKVMGQMKSRSYHTMMPNHQRAYNQLFSTHRFSNGFHTTAQVLGDYSSVQEVLDRISSVKSEAIVKQVGAIYLFDVKEKGKYFIDFKNGSGAVGEGEAPTKADVTISMNEEVFLKIFNRELAPASAFMTGKVKVSGDLAKALTLEKVMKATREAAEAAKNKGA